MIVRAGAAYGVLIELSYGAPDANIDWTLYGPAGVIISTGSVTVTPGAASVYIPVAGSDTAIPLGTYNSYRDLAWSYTVAGQHVSGEAHFSLEARAPFGASADGVRAKLGVTNAADLPDADISLISAFLSLQSTVTEPVLTAADPVSLSIRNAIEALAALDLIPTMAARIAKKEDSGTSSFQRQDIDWVAVQAALEQQVSGALEELIPGYDPITALTGLFIVAQQDTDPVTNAAYV